MPSNPSIRWEPASNLPTFSPRYPSGATSTIRQNDGTLYLFMDESGNLDFGPNGSKYFYMTCVAMRRPFVLDKSLAELKYDVIESGIAMEKFHACEDNNQVKTEVYSRISAQADNLGAYSVRIRKDSLPDDMKNASTLYRQAFEWIISEVYDREADSETRMVVVVTDSLPQEAKSHMVKSTLKSFMKAYFQNRAIPYCLLHHASCGWPYLQVTDYLSWAVQRWFERGLDWPFSIVSQLFREIGEA